MNLCDQTHWKANRQVVNSRHDQSRKNEQLIIGNDFHHVEIFGGNKKCEQKDI